MRRGYLHLRAPEPLDNKYWYSLLTGDADVSEPVVMRRMDGSRTGDFLSSEVIFPKLVSDRIVALFQGECFTGWTTYDVRLFGKTDEIRGYKGLSVLGRCGPIDKTKARLEWVEPNPELMALPISLTGRPVKPVQERIGMYFDPDTWDGSDFFIPQDTGWILVTARVANALNRIRATNVSLTPLTEQHLP
jgi:hypothetical protein